MACLFTSPFINGRIQNKAFFTPQQALSVQIFNCFFYFILYGIFERVVPSDKAIKDPLFTCLKRQRGSSEETNRLQHDISSDQSSAIHHESFDNPKHLRVLKIIISLFMKIIFRKQYLLIILARNLGKLQLLTKSHFQCMKVKFYGKWIYHSEKYSFQSVLGHNGAGKTTMINTLTGMLRLDEGRILYEGQDFVSNYEQIRKSFGLCVQRDILYDELTAAEHIEMILRLRGTPGNQIPHYLADISQKVVFFNISIITIPITGWSPK